MLKIVPARHSPSTSSRTGQGWCGPQTVRRFGGRMMEQQVWCWGRDIEHSDGNLLIDFGFERHRDRGVDDRSTCYRMDCDRLHVSLWGFGMFFGNRKDFVKSIRISEWEKTIEKYVVNVIFL